MSRIDSPELPPLMRLSVTLAIASSAALAIYGAHAVTGHASPEAIAGLAILTCVILAGEFAGARLLIHAAARHSEDAQSRRWLAIGLFAVVSVVAIGLSHHGLSTMTHAMSARELAPINRSIAVAEAKIVAIESERNEYRRQMNERSSALMKDLRETVTTLAGVERVQEIVRAASADDERRLEIDGELIRRARLELAGWQAEKESAPKPPHSVALLAISLVIQLLGGFLAWAATPRPAPLPPVGGDSAQMFDLDAIRKMNSEDLERVRSAGAAAMATATAALKRNKTAS